MSSIRNVSLGLLLFVLFPFVSPSVAAVDVSGTYISKYKHRKIKNGEPVVFLTQNGSKITGRLNWGMGDEIEGTIENGVIKFVWWAPRFFAERKGSLKVLDGGKRIEGTFRTGSGTQGEWTLIRDDGVLPTSLYDDPNVSRFEATLAAMELQAPRQTPVRVCAVSTGGDDCIRKSSGYVCLYGTSPRV